MLNKRPFPFLVLFTDVYWLFSFRRFLVYFYRRLHSIGIGYCDDIINNINLYELEYNFPKYFSYDLRNNLEKSKYPLTIFLDTYEHYIDPLRSGYEVAREKDLWLREEDGVIDSNPKVLWVVIGRDKLSTTSEINDNNSWDAIEPEEHLLNKLSKVDMMSYFNLAGIHNANLQNHFMQVSEGIPLILDMLYGQYCFLLQKKGMEEAYQIENYGISSEKVINRYLEICDIDTRLLIKELSVIEGEWTDDLIESIKPALEHYEEIRYESFCSYSSSLVTSKTENNIVKYEMQKIPRQIILKQVSEKTKERINKAILEYKTKKAKCVDNVDANSSSIEAAELVNEIAIDEYQYFVQNIKEKLSSAIVNYQLDMANQILFAYEKNPNIKLDTTTNLFIQLVSYRAYYFVNKGEYEKALNWIQKYEQMICDCTQIIDFESKSLYYSSLSAVYSANGEFETALKYDEELFRLRMKFLGIKNLDTVQSYNNLAKDYEDLGLYTKAQECAERCYELRSKFLGEQDPNTLIALNNLASIYSKQGDYSKACEKFEKCYELSKRSLGEFHPNTVTVLNGLELNYSELGNYEKSIEYARKCYDARKQILGEYHPQTLLALNNLALNYSNLGDYENAQELYEQCYELNRKQLGENHPSTLTVLNNLAANYHDLNNIEKAKEAFEKCYSARAKKLGETHPDTLTTLSNLANVYLSLKDYEKAQELLEKCYQLKVAILGKSHPDTLLTLNNLAGALSAQGRYERAHDYFQICYNISSKTLGSENPNTIKFFNNMKNNLVKFASRLFELAKQFSSNGDYENAKKYYHYCYDIEKNIFGENHSETVITLNNLGFTYINLGNYEKAIEFFEKCYNLSKIVFGEDNQNTNRFFHNFQTTLHTFANHLADNEEYERAQGYYEKCYDLVLNVLGEKDPQTLTILNNYALNCSCLGDYEKSLLLDSICLNFKEEVLGLENPETLTTLYNVVCDFSNNGDHEKALKYAKMCYELRKKVLGKNHPDTETTYYKMLEEALECDV